MSKQEEIKQTVSAFSKLMEERMLSKADENVGWKREFNAAGVRNEIHSRLIKVFDYRGSLSDDEVRKNLVDIANFAMMWHDLVPNDIPVNERRKGYKP